MTTTLSLTARKAQLAGLLAALDIGGASALFYAGTPPATPDLAAGQPLLGTIALASPSGVVGFTGALATLTMTVPRVAPATGTGTVGWVRLVNGAGNGFMDLPAGLAAAGLPVVVNVADVFTNGELQLVSCQLSE